MRYYATKSELEILNVLWKAGAPLSRAEILENSTDKTWKDNSIHILLNGMLKKGLVREDGFARSGKVWGRLYAPVITVEEYYREVLNASPGLDPFIFLKLVFERNKPDRETLERLQELIRATTANLDL